MSNLTLNSRTYKPAAPIVPLSLLREVFAATPLAVLVKACSTAVQQR